MISNAILSNPTPLRIAIFHQSLPEVMRKPGGVEIAVHRLANALSARNDTVVTVFSLTPAPSDAKYRHVRLRRIDRWLPRLLAMRILVLPLALNFLSFEDQEVLHLHGDDWFYFRRSVPTIRTLHGSALFEAGTATSFKRRISQRLIYVFEHLSARLATVCAAVGPQTMALYGGHRLVDNGVDLERFTPGTKSTRPSILYVGTWTGRKRGRFAYETFLSQVRPQIPDAELTMVCDYCPPADGVVHIVCPSDDVLATLYRSAWVFAYSSVYEGFGIPYLEAMASGTVVVTTRNPGAEYVLRNGDLGRIVDDEGFGKSIVNLLTNPLERTNFERIGLEAAKHFTWDRIAAAHMNIYREAVGH